MIFFEKIKKDIIESNGERGEEVYKKVKLNVIIILLITLLTHIFFIAQMNAIDIINDEIQLKNDFAELSFIVSPLGWLVSNFIIFFILGKIGILRDFIIFHVNTREFPDLKRELPDYFYEFIGIIAIYIGVIVSTAMSLLFFTGVMVLEVYSFYSLFIVTFVLIPLAWWMPTIGISFVWGFILFFVGSWTVLPILFILNFIIKKFKK